MTVAPDQAEPDRATDISRSVIVQAPAGSGKTTLLVERYLKLLAVVDKPEEILAITFTRKAASEMATRVLEALTQAAAGSGASPAAAAALARSEEKGWHLTRHPARLKIQTIDSLALSLTRGMPVAAGLNPSLGLTENGAPLYSRAATQLLMRLYEGGPLTDEIADFLRQCDNDPARAERLLASMLAKRDQWLDLVGSVVATHQNRPDQVTDVLRRGLDSLIDAVVERFSDAIGPDRLELLEQLINHAAAELGRTVQSRGERFRLAGECLTTKTGELRKQVTKREGFGTGFPDEKAAILALIQDLRDQELGQLAANLRFLPEDVLEASSVDRLVNVCINLALANAELDSVFAASGETDFTTLILNARAALGEANAPTELALSLDYRIHHMLVDEFQDTSVSQFQLFEQLLRGWVPGDGNTFFAVGDPMQSIYRFRDADVGLYYRAWQRGIAELSLERVVLSSNFRADAALVRWTNHAFARIMGTRQDPVLGQIAYTEATPTRSTERSSGSEHSSPIKLRQLATREDQVESIAAEIEHLLAESDGTIALLVRSRGQLTDLIRVLRARGINWRANDIDPLLERPVVRDLLLLVGALNDPYDRLSWLGLLRTPFVGVTLTDLEQMADVVDFATLLGLVRENSLEMAISADGMSRLARLAALWPADLADLHELPARSVLETLWLKLGGADAYDDPAALTQAGRLLDLLERIGSKSHSVEALRQAAERLFAVDLSESRLEILTIHKAKGLEFDHVLLPFLERTTRSDEAELLLWRALPEGLLMGVRGEEGPFDWLARENKFRERHERQRLFYVACTRAKQSLTLFTSAEDKPPDTAMLSLLWPQLESGDVGELQLERTAGERLPEQPDFFPATESDAAATGRPPDFLRLRSDYEWTPPAMLSFDGLVIDTAAKRQDPLEARMEVVLGIVVHRALENLSTAGLPDNVTEFVRQEQPRWRAMAAEHDLSAEDEDRVVEGTVAQLDRVLNHRQGRWLLAPRPDAQAELALTGLIDGAIQNLVIDRTFTDAETGERWIVDFKTAVPHPDIAEEVFLASEVSRYRPQLERYGTAAALLFDQPIRLAIYFTALPRLVELAS